MTLEFMSLSSDYKRQFGWRAWPTVFDALPPVRGQTVLDLGCGAGDQAAEFVARGARVMGFDMNGKLIDEARSRKLPDTEFRLVDLRTFPDLGVTTDGLWCSFTAALLSRGAPAWRRNRVRAVQCLSM